MNIDWGPKQLAIMGEVISWLDETKIWRTNPHLKTLKVAATTAAKLLGGDSEAKEIVLNTESESLQMENAGLSPVELHLLDAWLKKRGIESKQLEGPALKELNLSGNPLLFGMTKSSSDGPDEYVSDVHLKTFRDLCDAAFTSEIIELALDDTGMGPKAVRALTRKPVFQVLHKLTLSTHPPGDNTGKYTLRDSDIVDLTGAGLGAADVPVIAAWIARLEPSSDHRPKENVEVTRRKQEKGYDFPPIHTVKLDENPGLFQGPTGCDALTELTSRAKRVPSIHSLSVVKSLAMKTDFSEVQEISKWDEEAAIKTLATQLHPKSVNLKAEKKAQEAAVEAQEAAIETNEDQLHPQSVSKRVRKKHRRSKKIQEIEAKIIQCDGLPRSDMFSGNDIYATIRFLDYQLLRVEVARVFEQLGMSETARDEAIKEAEQHEDPGPHLVELILSKERPEYQQMEEDLEDSDIAARRAELELLMPTMHRTTVMDDAGVRARFGRDETEDEEIRRLESGSHAGTGENLGDGKGVKFTWPAVDTSARIVVEVWDCDQDGDKVDDLLGKASFLLHEVDQGKPSFSRWFELTRPGWLQHHGNVEEPQEDETEEEKEAREKRNEEARKARWHPSGRVQLHFSCRASDRAKVRTRGEESPWTSLRTLTVQNSESESKLTFDRSSVLHFDHLEVTHKESPLVSAWVLLCARAGSDPTVDQKELVELSLRHNPNLVGQNGQTDQHLTQFASLCCSMEMTNLQSIALDDIGMGPLALDIFSEHLPPKLTNLTIDSALIPFKLVLEKEMVLKDIGLSKRFAPLIRAWLQKPDVLDVLEAIDLDGNPALCGKVDSDGIMLELDGRVDAFKILCDGIQGTNVKRLSLRNTGMGEKSACLLAGLIRKMPLLLVHASATGQQGEDDLNLHGSFDDPRNPDVFIDTICELLSARIMQAKNGEPATESQRAQLASAVEAQNAVRAIFKKQPYKIKIVDRRLQPFPTAEQMELIKQELLQSTHVMIDTNHDGKVDQSDHQTGILYHTMSARGGTYRVPHWHKVQRQVRPEDFQYQSGIDDIDLGIEIDAMSYSYHRAFHQNYTLDSWSSALTQHIDLSGRYFSEGDAHVIVAWVSKENISANLKSLTLSSSGKQGKLVKTAAVESTNPEFRKDSAEMRQLLVTYTLTDFESGGVELANKNLGATDLIVLSGWLRRDSVAKNVTGINLADNPELCTSEIVLDESIEPLGYRTVSGGFPVLCQTIRDLPKVEYLNLRSTGIRTGQGGLAPTSGNIANEPPELGGSVPWGPEAKFLADLLNEKETPLDNTLTSLVIDCNPSPKDGEVEGRPLVDDFLRHDHGEGMASGEAVLRHHLDYFWKKNGKGAISGILAAEWLARQAELERQRKLRAKMREMSEETLNKTIFNAHARTGKKMTMMEIKSSISIPGNLADIYPEGVELPPDDENYGWSKTRRSLINSGARLRLRSHPQPRRMLRVCQGVAAGWVLRMW